MILGPTYDNLTATAGGGQAAGSPIREGINRFTTVATAADSARLPSAQDIDGETLVVVNAAAANSMNVFPAVGDAINALAADAAFAIAANKTVIFVCTGARRWHTNLTA